MKPGILRVSVTLLILALLMLGHLPSAHAQTAGADLALTKTADRTNVRIGQTITFTITVTNLGPDLAAGIYFGDSLPDPLNFVSVSCNKGPTFGGACAVDSLAVGESATIRIVATPITNPAKSERKFTNTAFIAASATLDPDPTNNQASLQFHIIGNTH